MTEVSKEKVIRAQLLTEGCFDPKKYEYDFSFKESKPDNFWGAHTTIEMMRALDHNPKIELDAKIIGLDGEALVTREVDSKTFRESFMAGDKRKFSMREYDAFGRYDNQGFNGGLVGQEFTPLLGGPFFKQLYYWTDYIRMHSECFYAMNFDPFAKAFLAITRDFVIGSGYEVQCDTTTRKGEVAMATWKAFEKANDLKQQLDQCTFELGGYGEVMWWWLPNNEAKITYQLRPTDTVPIGLIPRVRLVDPSNIIEIITYPEDITRKLAYIWLTPTQYQIYTTAFDAQVTGGKDEMQPTLKYIYRQIPAAQMLHYRINSVSNEKRGRSDLFPILSYLKRVRDSIDYALISLQKNAAWSIDTTIDGAQSDIDNYIMQQQQLGTIPPAGSDFVHSKAVQRQYLGNSNTSAGGGLGNAFEWGLSACCAGVQIPFNYLGTHLSAGATRASAIVATEPVAKKMEKRREVIKCMISDMWERLMKECGLGYVHCNILFPEIITGDRSQKLKDLTLAETNEWISPERTATLAAKEFGIQDFKYNVEMQTYQTQKPEIPAVLTGAPQQAGGSSSGGAGAGGNDLDQESALTGAERRDIKVNGTTL